MIHISMLDLVDVIALISITLLIGDELRVMDGRRQPLLAIAFAMVAIGSFVGIWFDIGPGEPKWWDVIIDVGLAVYLVLLRRLDTARQLRRLHLQRNTRSLH
ncbi:MAG: hypothetical protein J0I77_17760 [Rudaea sp.]|uniref:hypothetical protein n=1 Tax=unclassified Rudaea TaxID=2627037 RepID=UPI0010F5A103|nr:MULTISPECIES: hypothetical protein [unclassified Rudaea]MBN8887575.1 hypothetical protein [Rudaea sp.]MBQ3301507.1 hypothetical protein [Eggerthellaceae bacterium]